MFNALVDNTRIYYLYIIRYNTINKTLSKTFNDCLIFLKICLLMVL